MSPETNKTDSHKAGRKKHAKPLPEPRNVVEGIPDKAERPAPHRLLWILAVFTAWCGFLVFLLLAGRPHG